MATSPYGILGGFIPQDEQQARIIQFIREGRVPMLPRSNMAAGRLSPAPAPETAASVMPGRPAKPAGVLAAPAAGVETADSVMPEPASVSQFAASPVPPLPPASEVPTKAVDPALANESAIPAGTPIAAAMQSSFMPPGALSPDARRNAIYDGAIQAGIGLLANTADPAKGLAAGFEGFNKGYDARMDLEKSKGIPKITPLANGVAALVQYADGRTEVKPIAEVQKFLLQKELLEQFPGMQKLVAERDKQGRAITNNYRSVLDSTAGLSRTIAEARNQIGAFSAGPIGQATSWIGGTPGAALEATLKTIKANLGFNQLQQMRDASPTGGALGQVAVEELKFLQSVEAALDQKLLPSQLKSKLDEVESRLATRQQRMRQAYQEDVKRGLIPAGSVPELEGAGAAPSAGVTVPGASSRAQRYYD